MAELRVVVSLVRVRFSLATFVQISDIWAVFSESPILSGHPITKNEALASVFCLPQLLTPRGLW